MPSPQVGTNNCTSRYRTLSGGIGNSPSPTHSSDYVDDDDEDDEDDDLTTNTAVHNGLSSSVNILGNGSVIGIGSGGLGQQVVVSGTATSTNVANNLKSKRANLASHLHKTSSAVSYQKATVHYVSKAHFRLFT